LITTTSKFQVNADQISIWNLMNDPVELGKCIPGCEEVIVINETDSRWKMKINVGVISRKIDAKAKVTHRVQPSDLEINLEGVDGDLSGQFIVTLASANPNVTSINFTANINARGPFQWIVNQVIRSQLDSFVDNFSHCISKKIEAPR